MFATHYDGHPDSLGVTLQKMRRDVGLSGMVPSVIVRYLIPHSINAAHSDIIKTANKLMVDYIKKSGRGGYDWIWKEAHGQFVQNVRGYGDWAEYEYDISTRTGKIKVSELEGEYQRRKIVRQYFI